ncbi:hypothetical protein HYC85_004485 [Camellia sinensis]|uniref:Uncharacterized protein n=1 Tax=Camellia sinensis TaxID=4442 RepID=A0A7J7HWP4_CAMSI|nr:hypothetical protein HYC85_004485 [Camellia sinensis]
MRKTELLLLDFHLLQSLHSMNGRTLFPETKKGLRSDMFPLRKLDDQPTNRRFETWVRLTLQETEPFMSSSTKERGEGILVLFKSGTFVACPSKMGKIKEAITVDNTINLDGPGKARAPLSLLFCRTACPLFTAGYSLLLADQVTSLTKLPGTVTLVEPDLFSFVLSIKSNRNWACLEGSLGSGTFRWAKKEPQRK